MDFGIRMSGDYGIIESKASVSFAYFSQLNNKWLLSGMSGMLGLERDNGNQFPMDLIISL